MLQYMYTLLILIFNITKTGGAMRLPDKVESEEKMHFLTDYYINEFGLEILPFNNSDDRAWLKFYSKKKIRISGMLITWIVTIAYEM